MAVPADQERVRLEAPLIAIDRVIAEFALPRGIEVTKNLQDWPERSLTWGEGVRRRIQIYLQDPKAMTFNLWLCAWSDAKGSRHWKREFLVKAKPLAEFAADLPALLAEGEAKLQGWARNPELLEPASRR